MCKPRPEKLSGGAAARLSSVQRKGEGSQTQSRGTSRKRLRRQQKLAVLPGLLWAKLLRLSSRSVTRATFLWDIRSGGSAGGDDARGCADGKQSAARPDARARRAPARDGLQEDEIWKVIIFPCLDLTGVRNCARTNQKSLWTRRACTITCPVTITYSLI